MIDIKLIDNGNDSVVIMSPRERYKSKKTLELPVLYAHRCPICGNLIQVVFKTPTLIDTYPYEEVGIIDQEWGETRGTVTETLPNDKHKRRVSCYNTTFDSGLGYQKIVLKNHMLKMKAGVNKSHDGSHLHETGPKPCFYTGLTSFKEEVLIRDFLFFSGFKMEKIKDYPLPSLDVIAPRDIKDSVHIRVPPIGKGPEVVLITKKDLVYSFSHEIDPIWDKHVAQIKRS